MAKVKKVVKKGKKEEMMDMGFPQAKFMKKKMMKGKGKKK